jgi:hypothetical protein
MRPFARASDRALERLEDFEGKRLECALGLKWGVRPEIYADDREYGPGLVAAAERLKFSSGRAVLGAICVAAGEQPRYGSSDLWDSLLNVSRRHVKAQSAFSTINLPGIVGNVANKILLQAFVDVDATYEKVADQADFENFHLHSIYRLDHLGEFAIVPRDGEIKHGRLDQTAYTNKLETYGQIISLNRQDIVNDDIQAFRSLTSQLARKARISVERALYSQINEVVDSFFSLANGNRLTTTPLDIVGVGAAEAALLSMADAGGDPIYAAPRYVLVPPQLKAVADMIFVSDTIMQLSSTSKIPTANVFKGRFEVLSSPFLSSASIPGSSAGAWYLLANPDVLPSFQVCYLSGRRSPWIETSDTKFSLLGMSMRAIFDFGVARLDPRGAVKATP